MFRTFILLAALALISSATMPFGYMPARAADGSFVLRICDGMMPSAKGPIEAQAEQHGHHKHHDHSAHADGSHGDMVSMHHAEHEDAAHETRCNYAVTAAADVPKAPELEAATVCVIVPTQCQLKPLTAIYPPSLPPSTGPPAA